MSKYPIDRRNIRTFQKLLWKDLPGNHLPPDYYSDAAKDVLRLSSKNHVDVPILINKKSIHVLAAHPTPPVFDGPENRNGRRNFDEVSFWSHHLTQLDAVGTPDARAVPDDAGTRFPILRHDKSQTWTWLSLASPSPVARTEPDSFVAMGDLNADPEDGDGFAPSDTVRDPEIIRNGRQKYWLSPSELQSQRAMDALLRSEQISVSFVPRSRGGKAMAKQQGGANLGQNTDPAADTADWDDAPGGPGNLRVDYVLPSVDLTVVRGGVFWPTPDAPLVGTTLATVEKASDHRLVWIDIKLP